MPTTTLERPVLEFNGINFVHGDGIHLTIEDSPRDDLLGNLVIELDRSFNDNEQSWSVYYISTQSQGVTGAIPDESIGTRGGRPKRYDFGDRHITFHDSWALGSIFVNENGATTQIEDVTNLQHYIPLDLNWGINEYQSESDSPKLITHNPIRTLENKPGLLKILLTHHNPT